MGGEARELRELMCRVERLERQNRWLKRAGLAAVVLVGSAALGAAYARPAVPRKIVAHEYDVVNSASATVAQMSTVANRDRLANSGPKSAKRLMQGLEAL